MVDPLSYFLFQPVLHNLCNKARAMYCLIYGMMHIQDTLLVIGKPSYPATLDRISRTGLPGLHQLFKVDEGSSVQTLCDVIFALPDCVLADLMLDLSSLSISRSSQCSTTGLTKAVVCVIMSVG